jgi:hypothetical protein
MGEIPRDYPSVTEIRRLAEEVAELAARVRGETELRFAPERSPLAGADAADHEPPGRHLDRYAVGPDGRYLGTAADWTRLRECFSWVPDAFVNNAGPEPAGFDPLIEDMNAAWKALYHRESGAEPVGASIRTAESHLRNWSGAAAETFRADFVSRIPAAAKNQAHIAFVLEQSMLADRDLYIEARKDLKALAERTSDALESVTKCGGAESLSLWLNVFAIVGAAPVTVAGPAGEIAVTVAVSTVSGKALVDTAVKDEPVPTDIAADTVDGVLNNMVYAIHGIQRGVYNGERKIVDALWSNQNLMTGMPHAPGEASTRDAFLPPRPALAGESMIPDLVLRDFVPS